jgi:hypothetical protein
MVMSLISVDEPVHIANIMFVIRSMTRPKPSGKTPTELTCDDWTARPPTRRCPAAAATLFDTSGALGMRAEALTALAGSRRGVTS